VAKRGMIRNERTQGAAELVGLAEDMQAAPIITSLIFDLDGTLIDSCPGIQATLAVAFRAAGRAMPATDVRTVIGPPIRVIAARIDPSLSELELTTIEQTYRRVYDSEGWRETVAFPDVAPVLGSLHASGVRLFIVTNKPRIPSHKILEHLGLYALFTTVLTRDSRTPAYDNKAEMVRAIVASHSLAPESSALVGDTLEDEEAAYASNLAYIHAAYGYGTRKHAHASIACFAELTSALTRLGERPTTTTRG
jgi:phosphoglycolate phosphatase